MSDTYALIIDDNTYNVSVMGELLEAEGVMHIAFDGMNNLAGRLASVQPVNMIFLDLSLPHISGYELLKLIKANSKFSGTPVIAYTVHTAEMNAAHTMGFDGFLGKPIDADLFPEQLQHILNGEGVWYSP